MCKNTDKCNEFAWADTNDISDKQTEKEHMKTVNDSNSGSKIGDKKSDDNMHEMHKKRSLRDRNTTMAKRMKMSTPETNIGVWKKNQRFQGIDSKTGNYVSGTILSRTSKVGKSNTDVYNVKMDQGNYIGWFDLNTIKDNSEVSDDMEILVLFTTMMQ